MGGAPYTGLRLGDGPIFEISVSHSDVKEGPGKFTDTIYLHNSNSSSGYYC